MLKKTFDIKGMTCAACASHVEKAVSKVPGVSGVNVMLVKNRMTLISDDGVKDEAIIKAVEDAGYGASRAGSGEGARVAKTDDSEEQRRKRALIASFILLVALMALAMGPKLGFAPIKSAFASASVQGVLSLCIMWLQRRYYLSAWRALVHGGTNMDTLVSLGSLVSFAYSAFNLATLPQGAGLDALMGANPVFFDSAAGILCFVAIGKYFEERTRVRTADAVMKLYDLAPKFVTVRRADGRLDQIPLSEARKGDILVIKAGEQVGVDGVVVSGSGYCDESALTGEPRPVRKTEGSKITSSSILSSGAVEMRAEAVGSDTTLSKIIALVDDANSKKAPIARVADRVAGVFTPAVITVAAVVFCIWFFGMGAGAAVSLNYAICVLVISCPCALGLATPLAIVAGTGRAASAGVLFKSPEALETLRRATVFVFDKTGTLTTGRMDVIASRFNDGADADGAAMRAAALELKSGHPLAQAFGRKYGSGGLEAVDYKLIEGCGVTGVVDGRKVGVGNSTLAQKLGAELSDDDKAFISVHEQLGHAVMVLVEDGRVQGEVVIADEVRPSAKQAIADLKAMGVRPLMLTGDRKAVAGGVAEMLGIRDYRAELLPQDKAAIVRQLEDRGEHCVMVGDGINDSVAIATAETGIGIAGTSDIAVESCQVVLLKGNLGDCVNALAMSRRTMANIMENLFWAFAYNVVFIPVAAGAFSSFGLKLTPVAGALLMSLSSVCVGLNALRLTMARLKDYSDKKEEKLMKKTVHVSGMSCEHCVARVTKALKAVPGVADAEVSLKTQSAKLDCDDSVTSDMVKKAVEDAGYEFKSMQDA